MLKDSWPGSRDQDNFLEKKWPDLISVKIPKLATLIARLRYPHRKQIRTYYEVQFPTNSVLNDEIEKNQLKKGHKTQPESTR